MDSIRKYKYKLIKNLLTKEELKILKTYSKYKLKEDWTSDPQSPLAASWSKDALMTSMLELKLPLIERETGLKLFKTYVYWRYYVYGSILENHFDRASCEISVTACIHKTDNWPIYMGENPIEMEEGDGVVYLGVELEHGRKPFEGDGCAQVFFHYVDQNGPFSQFKDDPPELAQASREAARDYRNKLNKK